MPTSFNAMKNDDTIHREKFTINQNYQTLYKRSLEKSHECYDIGMITAVITTDGQLYSDLKEAEVYTYMIGGFGKQFHFGTTFKYVDNNVTSMTSYMFGGYTEKRIDCMRKIFIGESKNCECN